MASILKVDSIEPVTSGGAVKMPNIPLVYATRSSSQGITASNGTIELDVVEIDTHNGFNTSTHTYTVPVAGYWKFRATLSFTGANANETYIGVIIRLNGSNYVDLYENFHYGSTTAYGYATVETIIDCSVGDEISIFHSNSDAGNFTLNHDRKRTHLIEEFLG